MAVSWCSIKFFHSSSLTKCAEKSPLSKKNYFNCLKNCLTIINYVSFPSQNKYLNSYQFMQEQFVKKGKKQSTHAKRSLWIPKHTSYHWKTEQDPTVPFKWKKKLVSFWYFFPFQEPNPSLTPTHYQCSNTKKEHFIPWGVARLGNFGEEKGELFTLISMMPLPTGLLGTKSKKWWFEEKG